MTPTIFHLDYNVTGPERKRLVQAISTYTQADAKYLGAPTFAYEVDYFTIDRSGTVSFDDRADSEEVEGLIDALVEQGFVAPVSGPGHEDEEVSVEDSSGGTAPASAAQEGDILAVQMPAADFTPETLANLTNLLAAKGTLIRKAISAEDLPVQLSSESVSFPWFSSGATAEEVKAYTHLIAALCDMARNQKRISAREKETDNERYTFRCFLLRLGFIGAEFKAERKILLRNLSGNSAFKSGKRNAAPLEPEAPNTAMRIAFQGDPELAEALADELLIQQVNASFGEEAVS